MRRERLVGGYRLTAGRRDLDGRGAAGSDKSLDPSGRGIRGHPEALSCEGGGRGIKNRRDLLSAGEHVLSPAGHSCLGKMTAGRRDRSCSLEKDFLEAALQSGIQCFPAAANPASPITCSAYSFIASRSCSKLSST